MSVRAVDAGARGFIPSALARSYFGDHVSVIASSGRYRSGETA